MRKQIIYWNGVIRDFKLDGIIVDTNDERIILRRDNWDFRKYYEIGDSVKITLIIGAEKYYTDKFNKKCIRICGFVSDYMPTGFYLMDRDKDRFLRILIKETKASFSATVTLEGCDDFDGDIIVISLK